MPTNRSTTRKPRRTHNLGGCATCRRRHVKCDQARPRCSVCRKANLECGGFPSPIRWASLSTGPAPGKTSNPMKAAAASNKHSRQSPSNTTATAVSDSGSNHSDDQADACEEYSIRQQSPTAISQHIDLDPGSSVVIGEENAGLSTGPVGTDTVNAFSFDVNDSTDVPMVDPMVDWNWLFDVSSGLGWKDLFDSAATLSMTPDMPDRTLEALMEPGVQRSGQIWDQVMPLECHEQSLPYNKPQQWEENAIRPTTTILDPFLSNAAPEEVDESIVFEDAKMLLRHFREMVVPKFSPVPMTSTSPWDIMHWRAAIQTHADMTYLGSSNVRHASKANLFAVLGCAAHNFAGMRVDVNIGGISTTRARQILDYSYKRANSDMQESLKVEVTGPIKAKYKDQLMGITSLIALTTLMGMPNNARCYLIDAERLVRFRGLAKREVSRRARMLHHIYTWLRIIGESTFVLHDHKSSALQSKIESMFSANSEISGLSPTSDRSKTTTGEYSELDDFLRIETHATGSDTDLDSPKDQTVGLRDIHLADVRQWPQTLYMEVYGIPETWLSLVSQVTRMANVMDVLDSSSIAVPLHFTSSLQVKLNRLEHKICSFSAEHSTIFTMPPGPRNFAESTTVSPTPSMAHRAMLRAMSSALVIFFYRRIHKVHAWILQAHVNDVIKALKDFGEAHEHACSSTSGTIGTPWPAFIAGCEAMSSESRRWLSEWIENAASKSTSNGFLNSQQVMQRVWEQRDAGTKSSKENSSTPGKEGAVCSWVDILRQQKLWLMLY